MAADALCGVPAAPQLPPPNASSPSSPPSRERDEGPDGGGGGAASASVVPKLVSDLVLPLAAEALVGNACWRRDNTTSRESKHTTMARQLAQDAAENACLVIADLMGLRGLSSTDPWTHLLAEVRALRLETEFLENARSVIASAFVTQVDHELRAQR